MLPRTRDESGSSNTVDMVSAAPPAPFWTTNRRLTLVLIFVTIIFTCLLLYNVALPALPFTQDYFGTVNSTKELNHKMAAETDKLSSSLPFPTEDLLESEDVRLERVLKAAAMEDNTVILTTLNAAWSAPGSIIDLFLESFRSGNGTAELLEHLIIVALDGEAYARCKSVHVHCFALATEGVDFSGEKFFMTEGYLAMMWRRIDFLRLVLEKGYNFIFTDSDIMWFRNPLPWFYPDEDFQIACDRFFGNATDLENKLNGGFNYVRSNNRTIAFYKYWYSSRLRFPKRHDQDVLNLIKRDPDIGVRIMFLSTDYFGGFCSPSRDFGKVCTMHANCCVGLRNKVHDLRVVLDDWKKYVSWSPKKRSSRSYSWSVLQFSCG